MFQEKSSATFHRVVTLMGMARYLWAMVAATLLVLPSRAAENLKLNQHLDYSSDSQDGPLITGDHLDDGPVAGKPAYIIFYGEGCFNSKRQARRTVDLYEKYRGKVQFVVVDLDQKHPAVQEELVKKFYKGYIPHVVVLNRDGKPAYDASGEVDEKEISKIFESTLP
jgi:thiol-disulfide isomerase/thioredoxin